MKTFTIKLENGFTISQFASALVTNANTAEEALVQPEDCDTAAMAFYQENGEEIKIAAIQSN